MKFSISEVRSLASVYSAPELKDLLVDKYDIYLDDEDSFYCIYFSAKEKPKGYRGTMPGLPEPVFEVEKESGKILKVYYAR
jgi:hypothetical protein